MNSLDRLIDVVTDGRIDKLHHFCKIINIVYKFRFVEAKHEVIQHHVWEYAEQNDLDSISSEYIEILIKMMRKLYPNKFRKLYTLLDNRVIEVLPTINIDLDGSLTLAYTHTPNIVFEILDYTISDNYKRFNFRNEFYLYLVKFGIADVTKGLENFRRQVEIVIDSGIFGIELFNGEMNRFMSSIIEEKFDGKKVYFNGWVNDLDFIVSFKD